jgi:hypothetical protein
MDTKSVVGEYVIDCITAIAVGRHDDNSDFDDSNDYRAVRIPIKPILRCLARNRHHDPNYRTLRFTPTPSSVTPPAPGNAQRIGPLSRRRHAMHVCLTAFRAG